MAKHSVGRPPKGREAGAPQPPVDQAPLPEIINLDQIQGLKQRVRLGNKDYVFREPSIAGYAQLIKLQSQLADTVKPEELEKPDAMLRIQELQINTIRVFCPEFEVSGSELGMSQLKGLVDLTTRMIRDMQTRNIRLEDLGEEKGNG